MRRLVLLLPVALAGCGAESRENHPRPPVPITMAAAIHPGGIEVSPPRAGAGEITLIVSNQSGTPQTVTFETDELGGGTGGVRVRSGRIAPRSTGRLTVVPRAGTYSLHTSDRRIRPARVRIGPPRPSAQNRVLLP
ncbi:MAG TPA: hypothetical protein VNS09_12165 [Solirubrobacter sp.]|nr:hypothetical protein [Solirubrobacter sp.]